MSQSIFEALELLRQPIEAYLDELEDLIPDCYDDGLVLYQAGAVSGLHVCLGGGEIEAEVKVGKRTKTYHVRLVPLSGENQFEVLCTGGCFSLGCPHGVAFLMELLGQPESVQELPAQKAAQGIPVMDSDPSTLGGWVSLRLGGVIPPVIQEMLPILEGWWQSRLQRVPLLDLIKLIPKKVDPAPMRPICRITNTDRLQFFLRGFHRPMSGNTWVSSCSSSVTNQTL